MRTRMASWLVCIVALSLALATPISALAMSREQGLAYTHRPQKFDGSTDQFIVKLHPGVLRNRADSGFWRQFDSTARTSTAVVASYQRQYDASTHILRVSRNLDVKQLNAVIAAWQRIPGVALVEADTRMYTTTTPNDTFYDSQWDLMGYGSVYDGNNNYGIGVEEAWDAGHTGAGVVVAVLDTGILNHPDLTGKVVDQYDFVSYTAEANDGDGRDSNASDPGDWITVAEDASGYFAGCGDGDSSWHGTHVAGTIAAVTNNTIGVAGIARDANLIIGRVLGKCGGYTSDIADAIKWAAGLPVTGVPTTSYPADVINMSLGGSGSCPSTYQTAIDAAVAAGTTVVVAAGNSNLPASAFSPASCSNVITVASTAGNGKRAYYSNYGASVDVAAPGGDFYEDTMILSTHHTGETTPATGIYTYSYMQGTSMAAPHVAGLAALWYDLDPTATPAQIEDWIKTTTQSFPTDTAATGCASRGCGTGIISAANIKPAQTFSTSLVTSAEYGTTTTALSVSTDQGISGNWSTNTGTVCTVNGDNTVTTLRIGNCVLTYTNAGNTTYRSFSLTHTITVVKATQQLLGAVPSSVTGTQLSTSLSLLTDKGLRGSWTTSTPSYCKIVKNSVKGVAPGSCQITFTQKGNTVYNALTSVHTVNILPKIAQSYTAPVPTNIVGTNVSSALSFASDEGVVGKWTTANRSICRMKGRSVMGVTPGTCVIIFTNRGSDLYAPYTTTSPLTFNITIDPKLSQTYAVTIPSTLAVGGVLSLQTSTAESLSLKIKAVPGNTCRLRGSQLTALATGICTITLSNKGNATYAPFAQTSTITIP